MTTLSAIPIDVSPQARPLIEVKTRAATILRLGLFLFLLLVYGLLLNPYWIRHGDSELYLSAARSLALGHGYMFNGQPVGIAPPGWSLVLAGAMKLTTSLLMLKLIPMASMIGFLMLSYAILCRYTTPLIAALCIATTAMLEPVFSLSYLFFSDSLFSLVSILCVWFAIRINEGAASWWRIALLLLLCALSICIRWAGIFSLLLVIGALMKDEEPWPMKWNRRWTLAIACAVVSLAVFFTLRHMLNVERSRLDPRYDAFVSGTYDIDNADESRTDRTTRIENFGLWPAGLLCRVGVAYLPTRLAANIIGWVLGAATLFMILPLVARRDWIFFAAAMNVIVLDVVWPNPMVRYIVPIAPFIVFAVYQSIATLVSFLPHGVSVWARPAILNLIFSIALLINGIAYAGEAMVMHVKGFYSHYEGGVHKQMIDAAVYLNAQPRDQFEVAISQRWYRNGREEMTDGFRRAMFFLTDRPLLTMPEELCREPDDQVIAWLKAHNAKYYLYQPPFNVWWHFASKSRGSIALTQADIEWRLYEVEGDQVRRVQLDPITGWPTHVPGI